MKILHLNLERSKHILRVVELIKDKSPDIICFEEAIDNDIEKLSKKFNYKSEYSPLVKLTDGTQEGSAILSKYQPIEVRKYFYGDNQQDPPLINIENEHLKNGNRPKNRFFYLYSVLTIKILDENKKELTIATTHFPVTDHTTPGFSDHVFDEVSDIVEITESNRYFEKLMTIVRKLPNPVVFTADLNNPRGEFSYSKLAHELVDTVPQDINTTIDPELHSPSGLKLVIDTVMTSPDVEVISTEIIDNVSDHKAIIVEITLQK